MAAIDRLLMASAQVALRNSDYRISGFEACRTSL
jgi:hypothetical protein